MRRRLVALGAEHVEAARLADLRRPRPCSSLGQLRLELGGQRPAPSSVSRSTPSARELAHGETLGVAAEEDVDASAGHVGGHRHRAQAAGLGHDLGLAEVLLGVEDLVRDALPWPAAGESSSDLATEAVPTRIGWPLALRSTMSSTTALNFAVLGLEDQVGLVEADQLAGWSGWARPRGRRCVANSPASVSAVPVMPESFS